MCQFKGNETFIAQSGMTTHRIVKAVDVVSDQLQGLTFARENSARLVTQEFSLERAKETLSHSIIQASSLLNK
jgi:hypothetical protein